MITLDVSGKSKSFTEQFADAGIDHCDPANAHVVACAALNVAQALLRAVIELQKTGAKL